MGFINANMVIGFFIFVVGSVILTLCAKYERKVDAKLRDPKMRYAVIDGGKDDMVRKKNMLGNILAVIGTILSLGGFIFMIINI